LPRLVRLAQRQRASFEALRSVAMAQFIAGSCPTYALLERQLERSRGMAGKRA
jgi:hypothetical protein